MDTPGGLTSALDGPADPGISKGRLDLSGLYRLGRTLGRGHFAVVKLGRHVNTGQLVAVKMIDKTKLDVMAASHLLQEVRCMRLVQHPNVVRLYEVIDTPTTLYLVMELAEGGDLYDYILRHERGVAEVTAKRHFAQIVRAVAHCHQLHVVHRDLKPENVVFFPQQGAVKLTDFGFSNLFQPGMMLATSCGSLAYSAPEILLGEEYDAPAVEPDILTQRPTRPEPSDDHRQTAGKRVTYRGKGPGKKVEPAEDSDDQVELLSQSSKYAEPSEDIEKKYKIGTYKGKRPRTIVESAEDSDELLSQSSKSAEPTEGFKKKKKTDIWSLGVILYMLVCGVPPFQETNDSETLVMILDCRYSVPEHVSGECRDLISRMLQKDPSRRASLDDIGAHQWLQGLEDALLSPEAPPHWISGALTAGSPSSGAPECGDLLAKRTSTQQAFTGPWQPSVSFSLRPSPVEEPPVSKNLPALQQISEEEEEEEEEEMLEVDSQQKEELVEDTAEMEKEDEGCVISDQPVSRWNEPLGQTSGFGVSCCRPDFSNGDDEPNNNTDKPLPLSTSESSHSRISASSISLKEVKKTQKEEPKKKIGASVEDLPTDKSQPRSPQEARDEPAPRAEQGKRHSIKLRERLFQFPLCEKALAFNVPTQNKPKILPLAQYNCCHVL